MKKKNWVKSGFLIGMSLFILSTPFQAHAFTEGSKEKFKLFNQSPILSHLETSENKVHVSPLAIEQPQKPDASLLIIKYQKGFNKNIHKTAGVTLKKQFPALNYDVVSLPKNANLEKIVDTYQKDSKVLSVTPSVPYQTLEITDPKADKMIQHQILNTTEAQLLAGDEPVTVAVIDTGVYMEHTDLKSNLLPGVNILDPMRKSTPDLHGTHVAGIIGSVKNNGIGGYGVNPNASLLPIDVFNGSSSAYDYAIAEGILEAVEQGAQVINMSLGGPYPSAILEDAVAMAIDSGVTVIAAAGNSSNEEPMYPASFNGVISVGATNERNKLSWFSTYGPSVDVVAPGEDVYSTAYDASKKSTYMNLSGTSMASPVVAGVASLLLAKYPDLTPFQVETILKNTAMDLGGKGYDTSFGYGLIDPVAALSYDLSSLPEDPQWDEGDILSSANEITLSNNTAMAENSIQFPGETQWYSLKVNTGEFLQTVLSGDERFDFAYELLFYANNEDYPFDWLTINDVRNGTSEGNLYQAPENGTIVIGVKEIYGNSSASEAANYGLHLMKSSSLLEDALSEENSLSIELPFSSDESAAGPFYLTGENGDSDFYSFQVSEPQVVKVNLSAIPGIDPAINTYIEEEITDETGTVTERYQIAEGNRQGIGKGESIAFNAYPGVIYNVEITNLYFSDFDFTIENFDWTDGFSFMPVSSNIPYQLQLNGAVLPEDEDGFPYPSEDAVIFEEKWIQGKISSKEYANHMREKKENMPEYDELITEEEDFLLSIAQPLPIEGSASAYIQYSDDMDIYHIQPDETAIYEITGNISPVFEPALHLLVYEEMIGDWVEATSNMFDWTYKNSLEIGLNGGKDYLLVIANTLYQPDTEPYEISIKKSFEIADMNEPNDTDLTATPLLEGKISGDFANVADQDIFYLEPGEEGLYSFTVEPNPDQLNHSVPESLRSPIDPMLVIIEDLNGDGLLDVEDYDTIVLYDNGWDNEIEKGSINRKSESGYFVILVNFAWDTAARATPYELTFKQATTKDEDAGSVIKNNVPSKPLSLKKITDYQLEATGYLNALGEKNDEDWYILPAMKGTTAKVALAAPADVDGALTIYDKTGKLVMHSDSYRAGDDEVFNVSLDAGPYYIKVSDALGNPSADFYQLKINLEAQAGIVARIAGGGRYETSRAFTAQMSDHTLDTVILASGENYPDALAGGVLTNSMNGTILLVKNDPNTINKVKAEAKRLLKTGGKIVLLGGTGVIPANIESELKKDFKVERIAGDNRTETSIAIAKKVSAKPKEIIITSGLNFADALSVVPYATNQKIPILLNSSKTGLSNELIAYIKANSIKKVTLIGGTGPLPDKVAADLQASGVTSVERVSGDDRYETSLEVAKRYYPDIQLAAFASGKSFPDALSGSHMAAYWKMPILLTNGTALTPSIQAWLNNTHPKSLYIYGGTGVINKEIEAELNNYIK
ncbi:S8 family serine peptidase [Jeotgalibacillus soli]|uniref:Uncharacterized protein n=1 Tax=Jeotgalibacillus soli TaxID=889306 RepID=A0A0C2W756_9BACL|nr:S8 family serine peptidase [Jeotgalibacillus soli]KIL51863.1 hypothetical protein KP78_02330 [Jeotgalibacillus soli]